MKIVNYTFLLLTLIVISCSDNPYEVEDRLYQCMIDKYTDANLEVELNKFESYLIRESFLKSKSAKSYQLLFDRLTNPNVTNYIDYNKFEALREFAHNEMYLDSCLYGLDSMIVNESKFYKLNFKLNKNLINRGGIDVETVKIVYDSVITESEYTHSYYKSRVLLMALVLFDVEAGIPPSLNLSKAMPKYAGYMDCKIELIGSDSIYVNGRNSSLENLKISLAQFINENIPEYTISVYQKPTTTYGLYINVMNSIKEVIIEFRNQKSMELFGVPFFENASKMQVSEIEALVPKHVLEPPYEEILIYM